MEKIASHTEAKKTQKIGMSQIVHSLIIVVMQWYTLCRVYITRVGFVKFIQPGSSAEGARIEAPKAPRGLSGEGAMPPPQKIFFTFSLIILHFACILKHY